MKFFITNHANKRLKQRRIKYPTVDNVKPLSKRLRKTLNRVLRIQKNRVYFTAKANRPNIVHVYICEKIDEEREHYTIITAISLPLSTTKQLSRKLSNTSQ